MNQRLIGGEAWCRGTREPKVSNCDKSLYIRRFYDFPS